MAEVKICGITTPATLDAAAEAGAAYVGFVFFAKSPRAIAVDGAATLAERARGKGLRTVALFVDAPDALIDLVVGRIEPDVVQLHGAETPDRCRELRAHAGKPVWKAASVRSRDDVSAAVHAYVESGAADLVLFDAKPPEGATLPGGNGLAFDWRILDEIRGRMPFALAGGLTPLNVAEAIRRTGATLIDVSSGVESAPGVKDPVLIRRFLAAARAAIEAA